MKARLACLLLGHDLRVIGTLVFPRGECRRCGRTVYCSPN